MIASIKFNTTSFIQAVERLSDEVQNKVVTAAADAGGAVIVAAYRQSLQDQHKDGRKAGSFKNSATNKIDNFISAFQAVAKKTLLFKDGNGAYSVVGIQAAPGSWKPLAPQALFIEGGTEERQHKSGHPTGRGPALHLLEHAAESSVGAAQAAFVSTFEAGLTNATH